MDPALRACVQLALAGPHLVLGTLADAKLLLDMQAIVAARQADATT